jgi:hypothetical protein
LRALHRLVEIVANGVQEFDLQGDETRRGRGKRRRKGQGGDLFLDEGEGGVEGVVQRVVLLRLVQFPSHLLVELHEASLVLDQLTSRGDVVDDANIASEVQVGLGQEGSQTVVFRHHL